MKRPLSIIALIILLAAAALVGKTLATGKASGEDSQPAEQWEYLVVAGGNANLNPSGSSTLRKQPDGAFSRESFPLEQNLDKLGAKGWELVSISGPTGDPTFSFKRRK